MCGLVGILGNEYIAQEMYDALLTVQHRGQDAAGMITFNADKFHVRKELGLVNEVFRTRHMTKLLGHAAVGHTRYATLGGGEVENAQPFLGQSPFGVALALNGNVFNARELKQELFKKDHRMVNSDNDGEVLLNIFSKALSNLDANKIKPEHVWKAVNSVFKRCKGAYSVVAYIAKQGMVAFRDPHGIRPLLFGERKIGLQMEYIFASESIALDSLGFEFVDDVGPGEAIFIDDKTRRVHRKKVLEKKHTPCIFEYIYFARPDSILDRVSVYKSRIRMGTKLAQQIKDAKLDIDVVMPVPDSARTAAMALSDALGIRYREGLVKNRYIGRTFIMPGQKIRKKSVRQKLNPMPLEMKDKKILLVDDSIVRGNTSKEIIQMMKDAGAKKVYFASCSPQIISPCVYGIDIPTREELIAANHSVEEIRKFIGADALFYQTIEDTFDSCREGNPELKDFCMGCMDGVYKTGDVTEEILKANAEARLREKGACDSLEESEGPMVDPDNQMNLV
ncbi:MAG: amidophosphoribosyltransferase [Candidatus Gracilibacteria bacterium]